jgi:hypothetical protein
MEASKTKPLSMRRTETTQSSRRKTLIFSRGQIAFPEKDSFAFLLLILPIRSRPGWFARRRATHRGRAQGRCALRYTRYQDAVAFMVDYGFAEVAATAALAVIKEYTDEGGNVLAKTRRWPSRS